MKNNEKPMKNYENPMKTNEKPMKNNEKPAKTLGKHVYVTKTMRILRKNTFSSQNQ